MSFTLHMSAESVIKSVFTVLTGLYVLVTYSDTQGRSPSNPSVTEWAICWPIASWYMSWHVAICLSVVSLPSHLFMPITGVRDLVDCVAQNPYWMRWIVLLFWYLMGIPIANVMQYSCNVGAPGIWAHAGRVFIEGIAVFALGASIYVLDRYLLPLLHSYQVLSSSTAEAVHSTRAAESV